LANAYTTALPDLATAGMASGVTVIGMGERAVAKGASEEAGEAVVEGAENAAKGTAPKLISAPSVPEASVNVLPSSGKTFAVDAKGNVIPLKPGETLTGSPNSKWLQVRDKDGNPTGMRLDGGHNPSTHPDPRAQDAHAHVPGATNPDGTPWLPVNK
jgi:hypothetical protein